VEARRKEIATLTEGSLATTTVGCVEARRKEIATLAYGSLATTTVGKNATT
jgi:hypothetical protein